MSFQYVRDYATGSYESLDLTITNAGSSNIPLKQDGAAANLFSDLELYSDSGRTTPLSPADWEYYLTDVPYTALEAGAGGSGKTIYTEIRILNAAYQTGSIYVTYNSFGAYTSGNVSARQYIQITDADFTTLNYDYTISPDEYGTIIDASGVTTGSQTITLIKGTGPTGGANPSNKVTVIGSDTVQIDITWSGASFDWWLEAENTVDYFFNGAVLKRGHGYELIYLNHSNGSGVPTGDGTTGRKEALTNAQYEILFSGGTNDPDTSTYWSGVIRVIAGSAADSTGMTISSSTAIRPYYDQSLGNFNVEGAYYVKEIRRLYE